MEKALYCLTLVSADISYIIRHYLKFISIPPFPLLFRFCSFFVPVCATLILTATD